MCAFRPFNFEAGLLVTDKEGSQRGTHLVSTPFFLLFRLKMNKINSFYNKKDTAAEAERAFVKSCILESVFKLKDLFFKETV